VLKRAVDVVVAASALVVLAIPLVVIGVLVVLDSRGPVFYRAERVGYQGRRLRMLKFRKMHADAKGGALTTAEDERLTRLGRWLARTHLDELPQLWHVLTGEMSLVGPRPESPTFVALFPEDYEVILQVRPGLTGYTQVAFARALPQHRHAAEGRARPPLRQPPELRPRREAHDRDRDHPRRPARRRRPQDGPPHAAPAPRIGIGRS
jgi:lipopolysaccharide/colanic/teichoic acid biosynthesis glycosyltransferase